MASDSAANTPGADSAAATPSATTATNQVRPGGAPIRRYMNEKIVPHLLDGMTAVAKEQPPNPLRVLGEYLIQKSNEIEQQGVSKTPE
ncbi:COMPASS (complex proteins associated with Set1p) component [Aspergillus tubingensis]|nr:COMPASS (complex proteins associated with Set1p) component [Aspergillus tubingensis]